MVAPETDPFSLDTSCTKCPVGQFGSDDDNDDTSCPGTCSVGKSSSLGDTSCQDCVAGKYIKAASSACEDCDAGMSSLPGKTLKSDCTACNVGLYSSIGSACKNCPKGYEIKGTDVTQCFVCSFSKVSLLYSIFKCRLLKPLSHSPLIFFGVFFLYTILYMYTQYNIFQYQDQDNVANVECKTCDANTYQADHKMEAGSHNEKEDCIECATGLFAKQTETLPVQGCSACPAGKQAGSTECEECLAGQVSSSKTKLKCEHCDVGYYQNEEGLPSCIRCIPGQYQGLKGRTKCEECQQGRRDAGKWPTRNASTVCEKCESTDS